MKKIRSLIATLRLSPRKNSVNGGIDAGRSRFSLPPNHPEPANKTVLRKINEWWAGRQPRKKSARVGVKRTGGGLHILWLAGAGAVGVWLLVGVDGAAIMRRALAQIDLFRIVEISVAGAVHTDAEKIRVSSGITVNENMFSVSSAAVERAVTAAHPWIAEVELIRRWPGELLIEVDEYEPYALMTGGVHKNGRLYYLDRRGYPFAEVAAGDDLDFPVITGLQFDPAGVDTFAQLSEPLRFLRMLGNNDPNLPSQSISEIHLDGATGMVVHLVEHPFPIFLGREISREKYHRLRRVLEVLYKPRRDGMDIGKVDYISMDYLPDKVIISINESG